MKLNSTAWSARFGVLVTDPDGWDRQNFDASWAEEITEAEFKARLQKSTSLSVAPKADTQPIQAEDSRKARIVSQEPYADIYRRVVFEVDGAEYRATLAESGKCVEMFWASREKMYWSGLDRASALYGELAAILASLLARASAQGA